MVYLDMSTLEVGYLRCFIQVILPRPIFPPPPWKGLLTWPGNNFEVSIWKVEKHVGWVFGLGGSSDLPFFQRITYRSIYIYICIYRDIIIPAGGLQKAWIWNTVVFLIHMIFYINDYSTSSKQEWKNWIHCPEFHKKTTNVFKTRSTFICSI